MKLMDNNMDRAKVISSTIRAIIAVKTNLHRLNYFIVGSLIIRLNRSSKILRNMLSPRSVGSTSM